MGESTGELVGTAVIESVGELVVGANRGEGVGKLTGELVVAVMGESVGLA